MKISKGAQKVSRIHQVLDDISVVQDLNILKDGFSFLLRVKNEVCTIEKCIRDIAEIADEIIVVDNLSTDGTLEKLYDLEKEYDNLFLYQYNIVIPRAGKDHIDNYQREGFRRHNTLKNYYNWTLSKATYKSVIKWDADFYCIKNNLKEALDFISSKHNTFLFFSGITCFEHEDKYYLKKSNLYNEYRVFSKYSGFQWHDSLSSDGQINVCETSWLDISRADVRNLFIYTKPVFFEIKKTTKDEFFARSSLFNDGRDLVDHRILSNLVLNKYEPDIYYSENIYYEAQNFFMYRNNTVIKKSFIREFRDTSAPSVVLLENRRQKQSSAKVFLNVASAGIGGVETLTKNLFLYFNQFYDTQYLVSFQTNLDGFINLENFKEYIKSSKDQAYVLCVTDIFKTDELIKYRKKYGVKFFGMVHSDVAYYNKYFMENSAYMEKIIVINQQTYDKYKAKGINNIELLQNNISYEINADDGLRKLKYKLLYFSRTSQDKNLLMLLYAIKILITKLPSLTLDIYDDISEYYENYINLLDLHKHVIFKGRFLGDDKNEIYNAYDASILPSVSEGISLNILESINANTPILCTNIAPNRDLINNLLPMFDFGDLDYVALQNSYIYNYNDFLSFIGYDFLNNVAHSPYLTFNTNKISIFSKNIHKILFAIETFFENVTYYQNNTKILKSQLRPVYFDTDKYHHRFNKLIFES